MPLPTVQDWQSKEEWDQFCMDDNVMVKEFPDPRQRIAICNAIWEEA